MSLTDARLQVHWAAQAAASVGRTLLPPKPDDSHQAFTWSEEQHALMQVQAGIRIRDLTLLLDGDAFALRGSTLNEAFAFCEARLHVTLVRLGEGLPPHPVANGAAFDARAEDLQILDDLYANAARRLALFKSAHENAGPVRLWPHHFDIAILCDFGDGKTIGVGFVAGDAEIEEPYWYVTPWPYPKDTSNLPKLANGRWNTERWVGAVLPNADFLDEAFAHCAKLLE